MSRSSTPRERGIPCPYCGDTKSVTTDTRGRRGYITRRRQCPEGHRYSTTETQSTHPSRGRRVTSGFADAAKTRIDEVLR